jgi:hypothetical protein
MDGYDSGKGLWLSPGDVGEAHRCAAGVARAFQLGEVSVSIRRDKTEEGQFTGQEYLKFVFVKPLVRVCGCVLVLSITYLVVDQCWPSYSPGTERTVQSVGREVLMFQKTIQACPCDSCLKDGWPKGEPVARREVGVTCEKLITTDG